MNNSNIIIKQALGEFDYNDEIFRRISSKYKLEFDKIKNKDNSRRSVKFRNKETDKIDYVTEYEILAGFNTTNRIWCWSWNLITIKSHNKTLAIKLMNHSYKFGDENLQLQYILTTSRVILNTSIQVDIYLALARHILPIYFILPLKFISRNTSLIYYAIIVNNNDIEALYEKFSQK